MLHKMMNSSKESNTRIKSHLETLNFTLSTLSKEGSVMQNHNDPVTFIECPSIVFYYFHFQQATKRWVNFV